jgi:hypothetical protein
MEKNKRKLIPYSVYLPEDYYDKIREHAKNRKASSLVRDAICMILDGDDSFRAGYNKAVKDAIKIVSGCKEIQNLSIHKKYVKEILNEQIEQLEMK